MIRAAKEALNGIDPVDVNKSYRFEQGFTFELNLTGVARRAARRLRRARTRREATNEQPRDKRMTIDEVVGRARGRHDHRHRRLGARGASRWRWSARSCAPTSRTSPSCRYGGPDVGLLLRGRQGPQARLRASSRSTRSRSSRTSSRPARPAPSRGRRVDEGMFQTGLRAAAQRLPFLPMRAGLGSDVLVNNP